MPGLHRMDASAVPTDDVEPTKPAADPALEETILTWRCFNDDVHILDSRYNFLVTECGEDVYETDTVHSIIAQPATCLLCIADAL